MSCPGHGGLKRDTHFLWHSKSKFASLPGELGVWYSSVRSAFQQTGLEGNSSMTLLTIACYHLQHCLVIRDLLLGTISGKLLIRRLPQSIVLGKLQLWKRVSQMPTKSGTHCNQPKMGRAHGSSIHGLLCFYCCYDTSLWMALEHATNISRFKRIFEAWITIFGEYKDTGLVG